MGSLAPCSETANDNRGSPPDNAWHSEPGVWIRRLSHDFGFGQALWDEDFDVGGVDGLSRYASIDEGPARILQSLAFSDILDARI